MAFAPENLGVAPGGDPPAGGRGAGGRWACTTYAQHAPHLLSGGQKQRVAIAGVIAMRPKCIVLDEPTAMLDPQRAARRCIDTIQRLNREQGITVVLITHHMDEAAAGRPGGRDGRRAGRRRTARPRTVFTQVEELRSVGLTVPQTTELLL